MEMCFMTAKKGILHFHDSDVYHKWLFDTNFRACFEDTIETNLAATSKPFIMKKFSTSVLAAVFTAACAFATAQEDAGKAFADYGVGLGFSPFGPSLNLTHNLSAQTTINVGIGAFSGDNPWDQEIAGSTFSGTGETNWMGVFINHRPFSEYDWFRVNVGIGIGGIEGTLEDVNNANHTYSIRYADNPVGYVGVGFGSRPVEGFTFGFDLGGLHTSGPAITATGTDVNMEVMDAIPNTLGYGRVLPNLQLSVNYGF